MATVPTPRTVNVTRVFRSATDAQIAAGLDWYAAAYRDASALADRHGVSADVASGVLAALSPMNSWGANKAIADRALAAGGTLTSGYLTLGLTRANRIILGEAPADVLYSRTAHKVLAFYHCIATAGDTDTVCVDRHASDIAWGKRHNDATRPGLPTSRYNLIADAYRAASRILGHSPARVQAVTWVAWRERYWAAGAFNGQAIAG
jgi:hypothetical protein